MAENKANETEKTGFFKYISDNMAKCDTAQFMKAAYAMVDVVEKFDKATKINDIRAEKLKLDGKETDEEKAEKEKAFIKDKWSRILGSCFGENFDITAEMLAGFCFTTADEIKALAPYEINNLLFIMLSNERTKDFFTSLRLLGLIDSE